MRMLLPSDSLRFWNDLTSDLNQFVDRVIDDSRDGSGTREGANWVPAMDIVETEDGYQLSFDLPGLAIDEITLEIKDDLLTVSGERAAPADDQSQTAVRRERRYGKFQRVVRLPENVHRDGIDAEHRHGTLTVSLPKAPKPEPQRITVRPASGE